MAEQLNIIIVPHTHWDREWYQTFQQFRIRLVHAIDRLLDILDRDPKFTHFLLDGQTIVLDDYLEVRPEQEDHLKKYTRSGRIQVGPWYVQPDEFLVSGESLIRNLQIGLQRAAEFGEPMRVGYVPDCFGHIAQLPQILQGVGIDNAVFWRGVGAEAHQSEFYWAAPDGTNVLVLHLADALGYANARLMPLNPEEFVTRVELLAAPLLTRATTSTLLFMNGSDHLEPQEGLPEVIEVANTMLSHIDPQHEKILERYRHLRPGNTSHYDTMQVRIGTLPQYVEAVRQQLEHHVGASLADALPLQTLEHHVGTSHAAALPLQTLTGEMRSSQFSHLLPSVLSTRMWIKQQNALTEHLLERWVEPLAAWAWKLGAPYQAGLIKLAWKYLLQNHPHDSICGCSIDQVHRENSMRFAQSQQISESVTAQAMLSIASAINTQAPIATPHTGYEAVPIVAFNPAPGPRTEAVQTIIQLPGSLQNAVIVDENGSQMAYTLVNRWKQELGSMPLSREMIAAAVALEGAQAPGDLINMAQGLITTVLGQPENAYVITSVHIEADQRPGVASIEVMITPRGRISINQQELYAAERQILALLGREDIAIVEISAVDEARETIDFIAADLPAYGLKTFWIYPHGLQVQEELQLPSTAPLVDQHPDPRIENEFYTVEANKADGTLTVTDKQTGTVFTGLNRFVDGGDVGDLYNYCPPPAHDALISEPVDPPKIEIFSGPVRATMRISTHWLLPGACTPDRAERSMHMIVCPITSEISLTPGVRRIDIHTTVENKVKDHRLRVIFPVPYKLESAAAEGTFEVRSRPIAAYRPADVAEWAEEPVNTFPQKRFVDVSNDTIGLAVLNRGLPEYEIIDQSSSLDTVRNVVAPLAGARLPNPLAGARPSTTGARPSTTGVGPDTTAARPSTGGIRPNINTADPGEMAVALTLLRCVEWLSRGDLSTRRGHAGPMEYTPEAQCLGRHEFDYALVAHSGDWEANEALVLREAQAFNTPVRAIVTSQHQGQLASRTTLIEVEPRELVVSAIKRSNNGQGVIARVYNPLSHAVEASLRPGFACNSAFVANLLEEPQEQLFWSGENGERETLYMGIRAGQIMTILFQ